MGMMRRLQPLLRCRIGIAKLVILLLQLKQLLLLLGRSRVIAEQMGMLGQQLPLPRCRSTIVELKRLQLWLWLLACGCVLTGRSQQLSGRNRVIA